MFSKFLELLMVFTSLSPVLLTLWFKELSKNWNCTDGLTYLVIVIILGIIAFIILKISHKKLQLLPIKIESISTADNEMISFIFAYLIPLLEISYPILFFLIVLFGFIVLTTHSYHFNPMFNLFGYHYYKVSIEGGTTFILMTKKTLINTKQIKSIVQLTNYILLEKEE